MYQMLVRSTHDHEGGVWRRKVRAAIRAPVTAAATPAMTAWSAPLTKALAAVCSRSRFPVRRAAMAAAPTDDADMCAAAIRLAKTEALIEPQTATPSTL